MSRGRKSSQALVIAFVVATGGILQAPGAASDTVRGSWNDAEHPDFPLRPVTTASFSRLDEPPAHIEVVGEGYSLYAQVFLPSKVLGSDGIRGTADDERVPAVIHFTPYSAPAEVDAEWTDLVGAPPSRPGSAPTAPADLGFFDLVTYGYAALVIDTPGTGLSGGCADGFGPKEAKAIHDAVEWAAHQRWSSGKTAVFGVSASGGNALLAGVTHPPHLDAVISMNGLSSVYDFVYSDGVRRFEVDPAQARGDGQYGWTWKALVPGAARLCPEFAELVDEVHLQDASFDAFWRDREMRLRAQQMAVPASITGREVGPLIISSWRDTNLPASQQTRFFEAIPVDDPATHQDEGVPFKMLVMDKETHGGLGGLMSSRDPLRVLIHAWLDQFLYGYDTNVLRQAPVWSIGNDAYSRADFREIHLEASWPPADTSGVRLYLTGDGVATLSGTGSNDPIGTFQDTGRITEGEMLNRAWLHKQAGGARSASRGDFLWFETVPLEHPLRIAGEPVLRLRATTSAASTHWAVVVFDLGEIDDLYDRIGTPCLYTPVGPPPAIDPGANASNTEDPGVYPVHRTACTVSRGFLDARFAHGLDEPRPLEVGQPYDAAVRLVADDWTVPAGHRLGVAISSSNVWWGFSDTTAAQNTLLPGDRPPGLGDAKAWPAWRGTTTHLELPVAGGLDAARRALPGPGCGQGPMDPDCGSPQRRHGEPQSGHSSDVEALAPTPGVAHAGRALKPSGARAP